MNFKYFSHSNNQTNKISINHKQMCSSETKGENKEEIKLAAKQIEWWWPSFMQPNLSSCQRPPQATEGWISLSNLASFSLLSPILSQAQPYRNLISMVTIHSSTSQQGLHHWRPSISLSFRFILWLICD